MKRYRYSDSTLKGMTKDELIRYVRMCEHNQDVAEESLAQQYENVKDWQPVVHAKWIPKETIIRSPFAKNYICSACGNDDNKTQYCSYCGAKMDLED